MDTEKVIELQRLVYYEKLKPQGGDKLKIQKWQQEVDAEFEKFNSKLK